MQLHMMMTIAPSTRIGVYMYKNQRMRVEDGIIPMLFNSVATSYLKQRPDQEPHFRNALRRVQEDINSETEGSKGAYNTLKRLDNKIIKYFTKNKWDTRKAFMILSHLAAALIASEAVELRKSTKKVLKVGTWIVRKTYKDDEIGETIKRIDASAANQTPKILKLIQDEGYF